MSSVERIEQMLKMEVNKPQKDGAGIYVANRVDSAVRVKTLAECLRILKKEPDEAKQL